MRRLLAALTLASSLGLAAPCTAFTIGSGVSEGCHERISAQAFRRFLATFQPKHRDHRLHRRWRRLSRKLAEVAGMPELDDRQAFVLLSLIVGVRSPDTHGHSISELSSLRGIHADPDPAGQYAHALRGLSDDYEEGNVAAVEGTRRSIADSVAQVIASSSAPWDAQFGHAPMYFDFYGVVNVPVFLPAFYFGRAAHTVQDSFAHALRDEASGLRQIVHVLNYIEAIGDDYSERRDGVSHSNGMDSCAAEMHVRVEGATTATLELLQTAIAVRNTGDPTALQAYLDRWFTLRAACSVENQMCANAKWLAVARRGPTGPYLFGRTRPADDVYDGRRLRTAVRHPER
ncbi:MAG TPA: hypothetical protein VFZ61_28385 [Polyangiales bacterium]